MMSSSLRTQPATSTRKISEATRRNILDELSAGHVDWSGRLKETDFLDRMWDLSQMRSTDSRFRDAWGDIYQHRERNWDWEDDWVFHDGRFNLLRCDDEIFLAFISEIVHPVVREDQEEVSGLVTMFNRHLAVDGWQLVETSQLSGRPVYGGRRRGELQLVPSEDDLARYSRVDDPAVLEQHYSRIRRAITDDPAAAISSSKELAESVCKVILDAYGVEYSSSASLMDLYKAVQVELKLNAEAIPESKKGSEAAVRILRSVASAVQGLAELRNQVGTGHGRTSVSPAQPRHARLAFNFAHTITEFLLDTWHEREGS